MENKGDETIYHEVDEMSEVGQNVKSQTKFKESEKC